MATVILAVDTLAAAKVLGLLTSAAFVSALSALVINWRIQSRANWRGAAEDRRLDTLAASDVYERAMAQSRLDRDQAAADVREALASRDRLIEALQRGQASQERRLDEALQAVEDCRSRELVLIARLAERGYDSP